MSSSNKMKAIKGKRVCFNCLKGNHVSKKCQSRKVCNVPTSNGHRCGKDHHGLLHDVYVEGLMFHPSMSLRYEGHF